MKIATALIVLLMMLLIACGVQQQETSEEQTQHQDTEGEQQVDTSSQEEQEPSQETDEEQTQQMQDHEGEETMAATRVEIKTNKGVIEVELYDDKAPVTTTNFKELIQRKFYDSLTFHRYEPGFVIQGGDPTATGAGGSEKTIPLEIHNDLKHTKGAVAMARTNDPNSATSQFYITLEATPFLDGQYAVFGQVTKGMDVVEQLRAKDVMETIRIIE